jgi:hypothetical protein
LIVARDFQFLAPKLTLVSPARRADMPCRTSY